LLAIFSSVAKALASGGVADGAFSFFRRPTNVSVKDVLHADKKKKKAESDP
jgi:hypothetical protein